MECAGHTMITVALLGWYQVSWDYITSLASPAVATRPCSRDPAHPSQPWRAAMLVIP